MVYMFVIFFKTEKNSKFLPVCTMSGLQRPCFENYRQNLKFTPNGRTEFIPTFSGYPFWWTCKDLFPYRFVQLSKALVITSHLEFSEPK